jgi:hypothetical protein
MALMLLTTWVWPTRKIHEKARLHEHVQVDQLYMQTYKKEEDSGSDGGRRRAHERREDAKTAPPVHIERAMCNVSAERKG